ncbi:HAD hydrolase family protein [Gottfriedia acidiceleris]|nr:HAD hydrolase family protein [Bacillus sp. AFS096315]
MILKCFVKLGVAIGNATDEVKAASDFVTGHHENDGLAEFIEHYHLNQKKHCDLVFFENVILKSLVNRRKS